MSCFIEYWAVGKVQKSSNSVCYTPSSEPLKSTMELFRRNGVVSLTKEDVLYAQAIKSFPLKENLWALHH
jgi:hypothetical protein